MTVDYLRLTSAIRLKKGNETSHVRGDEYAVDPDRTPQGVMIAWGNEVVFIPWHMVREIHYVGNRDETGFMPVTSPVSEPVTSPVANPVSVERPGGGYQLGVETGLAEVISGGDSETDSAMKKPLFRKRGRPPKVR